jgi:hypothetical protein
MRHHQTTAEINPAYQKAYAALYGDTDDTAMAYGGDTHASRCRS